MVRRRIEEAFEEGQLDRSDLALRDLSTIAETMARSLLSLRPAGSDALPGPEIEKPPSPSVRLVGDP
jgi:hypothetical protein